MQPIRRRDSAPLVPKNWRGVPGVEEAIAEGKLLPAPLASGMSISALRGEVLGPETKGMDIRGMGVQGLAARPSTSPDALVAAYRRSELVYACIKVKGDAAKDPRIKVETRPAKGDWTEEAGHPLRRLMMRPNPYMDEAALLRAAIISMDVDNRFYAEKVRSDAGAVVELHPLDPTKVKKVNQRNADGSQTLKHYEWRDGSYKKEIPPEDMLVREDWSLGGALSPLAVAMGSVEMDANQTDYIRAFFANGGMPSGILSFEDRVLTPEEQTKLGLQWRMKYGMGGSAQHAPAFLDKSAKYQEIGSKLNELDSETLRSLAESRVCMAFGVPPLIVYAYVGLLRATYSNLKEAWASFWDATMSPLLKDWRAFFTWSLLTEFVDEELILGERIRLNWDLTQVAALQDDVDAIHDRTRKSFTVGGMNVDEFRAQIGLGPHPDKAIGERFPYLDAVLARSVPATPANDEQPTDEQGSNVATDEAMEE